MKAVIVYESLYGNTREVAEAVADGLRRHGDVELLAVRDADATALEGAELLVVGGPTHMHGMASHLSVRGAAEEARKKDLEERLEPGVEGPVLRDWLDGLPRAAQIAAAAFDTRIGRPAILTGSAAKGIGRRLERHGYRLVVEPESFIVDGSEGPLHAGELERARGWGASIGAARSA